MRTDPAHEFLGMRLNNWVSILVFLGALAYFLRVTRAAAARRLERDGVLTLVTAEGEPDRRGASPAAPAVRSRPRWTTVRRRRRCAGRWCGRRWPAGRWSGATWRRRPRWTKAPTSRPAQRRSRRCEPRSWSVRESVASPRPGRWPAPAGRSPSWSGATGCVAAAPRSWCLAQRRGRAAARSGWPGRHRVPDGRWRPAAAGRPVAGGGGPDVAPPPPGRPMPQWSVLLRSVLLRRSTLRWSWCTPTTCTTRSWPASGTTSRSGPGSRSPPYAPAPRAGPAVGTGKHTFEADLVVAADGSRQPRPAAGCAPAVHPGLSRLRRLAGGDPLVPRTRAAGDRAGRRGDARRGLPLPARLPGRPWHLRRLDRGAASTGRPPFPGRCPPGVRRRPSWPCCGGGSPTGSPRSAELLEATEPDDLGPAGRRGLPARCRRASAFPVGTGGCGPAGRRGPRADPGAHPGRLPGLRGRGHPARAGAYGRAGPPAARGAGRLHAGPPHPGGPDRQGAPAGWAWCCKRKAGSRYAPATWPWAACRPGY